MTNKTAISFSPRIRKYLSKIVYLQFALFLSTKKRQLIKINRKRDQKPKKIKGYV
jgi:hypothetical protein